jgi:hypothetical protein
MKLITKLYQNIISFLIGIKNIIVYIPVIYKDRDWDFYFLKKIMRFKLLRMSRYFYKYGITEYNDLTIKRINFCIKILDRMEDEYESYNHPEYKQWLSDTVISFEPYDENFKTIIFDRELEKDKRDFYYNWYKHNYNRDKKLLFDIMIKYIDTWWD